MTAPEGTHTYSYNDIYELTGVTGVQAHSYAYDNVGNRETVDNVSYTSNNLNQYTYVGAQAITYDSNDNLAGDGNNSYTYDEINRLVTATNSAHSASYTYDAMNRRVSKTVDSTTTYFVYSGNEVIAEYSSTGSLIAEYVLGSGVDEVLTMERGASTYYYHYDGLGSIRFITDTNGSTVEQYRYDPYGVPEIRDASNQVISSSAIDNPYMFTGRRWDEETEIYHYRSRAYDPVLGRFLQRDPLGYVDSMNLYSYVTNNPINWIDPFELRKFDWRLLSGCDKNDLQRAQEAWERARTRKTPCGEKTQGAKNIEELFDSPFQVTVYVGKSAYAGRTVPRNESEAFEGGDGTGSKVYIDPNETKPLSGGNVPRDLESQFAHESQHAVEFARGKASRSRKTREQNGELSSF